MKRFKFVFVFIFLVLIIPFYSYDFIASARSIAWGGAYASIGDGFEALAYNPSGIYMTNKRMGLDILGSRSFRLFSQFFSTQTAIDILHIKNNGGELNRLIPKATTIWGSSFGVDTNILSLSSYINLDNFGIGFFLKNKQFSYITLDSGLYNMILNEANFNGSQSLSIRGLVFDYLDFGFSMSTRVRFLERVTKIPKIYAGFTTHLYVPLFFNELNVKGTISSEPKDVTYNAIHGNIYAYNINLSGHNRSGGLVPYILKDTIGPLFDPSSDTGKIVNTFLSDKSGVGDFGIGFDFGFTLVLNQYVKVGFAINDLGFIIFPKLAKNKMNEDIIKIDLSSVINSLSGGGDGSEAGDFININSPIIPDASSETFAMVSPLSIRTGVSFTPVYNKYFDLILALDISVSDFYKIAFEGYPTFAIGTGIEFAPKFGWFRMPIIAAFNFNTESLGPSFSFGIGLHLAALKLMIAVKGLEALIEGYGSNDMAIGLDFKFEFK